MKSRLPREVVQTPTPSAVRQPPTADLSGQLDVADTAGVRWNTMVASSSSLITGMLNAAILAVSARQGQTGEIAAYTVMTAALAWVSIMAAGGSSLLYVTGSEPERQAVRSQRLLIAVPGMAATTACVAVFYVDRGYNAVALATAGVVAIGNSLSELQSGDLARQMRFLAGAVAICATKLLALAFILVGAPFTASLAVVSVIQFVAIETLLCSGRIGRRPIWHGLSARSAVRAFRMNRQLFVYSLAEVFTWRAASTALSLVASPRVVGCFGALVSVSQALFAVLYNGLRVPMAVRTRRRHGLAASTTASREGEVITVATAMTISICVVIAAPWVTTEVLRLPIPESATWLQLFAVALPCLTINQAVAFRRIGDGDYRGATRVALLIAALTALSLAVQLPNLGPTGAAGVTALAQALTIGVLGALALSRRTTSAETGRAAPSQRRNARPLPDRHPN